MRVNMLRWFGHVIESDLVAVRVLSGYGKQYIKRQSKTEEEKDGQNRE